MIDVLYFNGQEVQATFGIIPIMVEGGQAGSGKRLAARAAGGLLGGAARTLPLLDLPQGAGSIDPGITIGEDTRGILITAMVEAADQLALTAVLDAIKEVCGTGLVEIRGPYSTSRAFYGILETPDVEPYTPTILNGWASLLLAFTCPNPYAFALAPNTVSFSSVLVDVPMGTAPSVGQDQWSAMIEIVGPAVNPALYYADFRSDILGIMPFLTTLAAGDLLRIDVGRRRVRQVVSGVESNAFNLLVAGYAFPALDPSDGSIVNARYPKLSVSTGSGSIRYFEVWR